MPRLAPEPVLIACGGTSSFADDRSTTCADCGAPIVHRPHVPEPSTKVCMACASRRMAAATGRVVPVITWRTLVEVALYHARTQGRG